MTARQHAAITGRTQKSCTAVLCDVPNSATNLVLKNCSAVNWFLGLHTNLDIYIIDWYANSPWNLFLIDQLLFSKLFSNARSTIAFRSIVSANRRVRSRKNIDDFRDSKLVRKQIKSKIWMWQWNHFKSGTAVIEDCFDHINLNLRAHGTHWNVTNNLINILHDNRMK